ncbi:MAG TPA: glycosyl hydrolase family 43 [Leptospiraceae bacterium]|nr:glycosyl hydrolase family 43 [Leptospiraceae bacterium]HMW08476.1 glycosyl hydrolase family 43 [Leptospiraceae bacterium]HMX33941.1 glycosyl hydrolase family 43 [Leptospiraceae bacterium]HMY34236.1 glycosyl hydrolase family 43 [Leptospiraceae bacterium]HMZ67371.1 glycosyl hydrolase family 43 [Leptospiraceae bacterium]
MNQFTLEQIKVIQWKEFDKNPILNPPIFSPILADPSFLFPEESPNSLWNLFAHSIYGIHHYTSKDGIKWIYNKHLFFNAMRPYIFKEDDRYYILYEKYHYFQILYSWMKAFKWNSHLEIRESKDLIHWSKPHTILSPTLDWHKNNTLGNSVSNPCLLKVGEEYRLYFSSSLSFIPDCGFSEPRFIGLARSKNILGPYLPDNAPILSPKDSDPWMNLAAGSIKVIQIKDGFLGFQNGIYLENNQSGSAILLMHSKDGINWNRVHSNPILKPYSGWMRSHVYALDVKYNSSFQKFYLYFNARNDWHWTKGKENIGLLYGEGKEI